MERLTEQELLWIVVTKLIFRSYASNYKRYTAAKSSDAYMD